MLKRSSQLSADGVLDLAIYDVIGQDWFGNGITAAWVRNEIANAGNVRRINVLLNSPGGDAFEGIAIYNELAAQKVRVNVIVRGLAASAASIIAMAGKKITMNTGAMLMIHNAWALAMGNADQMDKTATMLRSINSSIANVYAARGNMPAAHFQSLMNAETWLSGEDAKALGMADDVTSAPDPLNDQPIFAEPRRFGFKNLPESAKRFFAAETDRAVEQRKIVESVQAESREVRSFDCAELRADAETGNISGYAALFDHEAEIKNGDFEVVRRGAFKNSLSGGEDIFAFWNHDSNIVLGSRNNGTLKLWEDERGLCFEVTPGQSAEAQSKAESIRRGDVKKMSFAFSPQLQNRKARAAGGTLRELLAVKLWEVSPVPFPAYEGTSVTARNAETILESVPERKGLDPRAAKLRLAGARLNGGY